jgi:hypothetical protein
MSPGLASEITQYPLSIIRRVYADVRTAAWFSPRAKPTQARKNIRNRNALTERPPKLNA